MRGRLRLSMDEVRFVRSYVRHGGVRGEVCRDLGISVGEYGRYFSRPVVSAAVVRVLLRRSFSWSRAVRLSVDFLARVVVDEDVSVSQRISSAKSLLDYASKLTPGVVTGEGSEDRDLDRAAGKVLKMVRGKGGARERVAG